MTTLNQSMIDVADAYASLAALRAAHLQLLEQRRNGGLGADFLIALDHFVQRAAITGLILANDSERTAAQSILDYWTNVLHRAGGNQHDVVLADFDPLLAPELPNTPSPYVGLEAFYENDQARFFGRQHLVSELIECLRQQRLLAVVGPSGSGKSSVVRAGLLPRLREGALQGSDKWLYVPPIVPGSDPLAALAHAIRPRTVASDRWQQVITGFRQQPDYLRQIFQHVTTRSVVLVIDQFEELFTLGSSVSDRQAFADNLLDLACDPDRSHRVIVTMRVDFEERVQALPAFHEAFADGRMSVVPLSAGELRQAIEQPAEQVGLKFEEDLVERLLHDISGEPAGLPLLQFTLLTLWEERQRNRVTIEAYDRVGGGRLALARRADAFYNSLIPQDQVTARRILLKMVRPSQGMEVTSKRILRSALFEQSDDPGRVERVLNKLIDARLVRLTEGETLQDAQVEVAHEALVRNWPTLVDWLEKERDNMRQRINLSEIATQWHSMGRDPAQLWRGTLLHEATRYNDLDAIERAFVRAGLVAEARQQEELLRAEREREQARERELAQMRALAAEQERRAQAEGERAEEQSRRLKVEQRRAEEQRRSAGRLRRLATMLSVVLLVAIAAAAFAGFQQFVLGQIQQQASAAKSQAALAQRDAANATTAQAQAKRQADDAQATSVRAAAQATQAAQARSTAEQQASDTNSTIIPLKTSVQVAQGQFDQAKLTATIIQQSVADAQAAAATAQTALSDAQSNVSTARADAEAAKMDAERNSADAERSKKDAEVAQTSAADAQVLAATVQRKSQFAEAAATKVIQDAQQTLQSLETTLTALAPTNTPTPTGTLTVTPTVTRTATPTP